MYFYDILIKLNSNTLEYILVVGVAQSFLSNNQIVIRNRELLILKDDKLLLKTKGFTSNSRLNNT